MRSRKISCAVAFTFFGVFIAAAVPDHALAENVLILSQGSFFTTALQDNNRLQNVLEAYGNSVKIGGPYASFDGTELEGQNVVILSQFDVPDMPIKGQQALVDFVSRGGGLIANAWTVWKWAAQYNDYFVLQGGLERLGSLLPVQRISLRGYTYDTGGLTLTEATRDPVLMRGIPPSFSFGVDTNTQDEVGAEALLAPKLAATVFYASAGSYNSAYPQGRQTKTLGLVGWRFGNGHVLQFSTTFNDELANATFDRLLANAVTWAGQANRGPLTSLTLTPAGAATTSTFGISPPVAVGYARAAVDSGAAPYGTAVFSLSENGFIVSEAGVPASPPVQSARVFVEYRTGITAGIGTIDAYTGLAIASGSASTASLTYTLRDRDGQIIATGHGSLPPNAHRAKFVHELQDIAPDFNLPANFSGLIQYGSLEISSTQPVSVLGLRLIVNQRAEALLTSTSVADLSQQLTSSPLYFPQLADGGGYTTTVILSNTSGATETGTISISDDDGAPLSVGPVGGTVGSTFSYSIPAGGTFIFQTDGSPSLVRVGSVKVAADSGSNAPVGVGVFSFSPAGILVTESGIPSSVPTTRARLYVDMSNGHDTGLAISSPGSEPITVTLQAFDETAGNAGNGPATVNLPANGHVAAFVGQLISGLFDGFTGVLDLTSSSPFVPLTLRSLTNGRGEFLLTTFPTADLTQPAPTPIVFPQIADGGGYTTQFIFISAGGGASVSLDFIDDNGAALSFGPTP
jgi:hypothetical protein